MAKMRDTQDALAAQMKEADGVHHDLEQRVSVVHQSLHNIMLQVERVERVTGEVWQQSKSNADAIRHSTNNASAILAAVLDSRKASEERHAQLSLEARELAERLDRYEDRVETLEEQFDKRLQNLEKSFPSRAWSLTLAAASWLLTAGVAGLATITWSIWGKWIGA